MMTKKHTTFAFLAVAAALLLAACENQMEPAQRAIAGIENAIDAAKDAPKYIPDQLAAVQAKLADLKTAYDAKNYKAVLSGAPPVLAEAQGLLGATMLKKEAVAKASAEEWPGLAAALPGLLASVTKRATALSKHPPAGVDMAAAKSALDDANLAWTKAQAANTAGDPEAAVASAHDAKAKLEAAAAAMKMTLPATPAPPAAK